MKLAIAAIAFACLSFGGADAAAAVRGTKEDSNSDAVPDTRKLPEVGGLEPVVLPGPDPQPRVGTDPDDVDEDHWGIHYSTGSCTCAKDAYIAVYKEAQSQLKMVPLIATDGDPNDSIFYKIQREINRLLDFAVCFLHHIDCGCDDGFRFKVFNQYKVSTYQCCCDVNAIRDIIIGGIKELAQWEMTMHMDGTGVHTVVDEALVHKRAQYHLFDRVVWNVYKQSRKVGEVYKETMEDCLEAICADDSIYLPTYTSNPRQDPAFPPPGTGCGDIPTCLNVCNDEGKTICVDGMMGGLSPPVDDCATNPAAACPGQNCIPNWTGAGNSYLCAPDCPPGMP